MFINHPFFKRQLQRQSRLEARGFVRFERLAIIAVTLCVNLAVLFLTVDPRNVYFPNPGQSGIQFDWQVALQLSVWLLHLVALVLTIITAVHFSSEFHSIEGELISLTPVRAPTLFLAYWWASIRHMRGWIVALGVVQMIALATIVLAYSTRDLYWGLQTAFSSCLGYGRCGDIWPISGSLSYRWDFWQIAFGLITAMLLCFLQIGSAAALAVAIGLWRRSPTVAVLIAVELRALPIIIFSLYPDSPRANGYFFIRWMEYNWFTFVDGGTTAVMHFGLPTPSGGIFKDVFQRGVLALSAVLLMFGAYSAISLIIAWIALRRRGVD